MVPALRALPTTPRGFACALALALPLAVVSPTRAFAQTVADVAARGACDTAGVVGLSDQLVRAQLCGMPGVFVPFAPHANVTLASTHLHPFLVASARDAVWAASDTTALDVTSAFRTLADQYVLYYSGACALAAQPGNSNHETGRAVDLSNYAAALSAMVNAGCTHTYPSSDPVHFDCPGDDLRAESIRAFQRLWNVNNPQDTIAEDGLYGPMTEQRLGMSPAGGFAVEVPCGTDAGMGDDARSGDDASAAVDAMADGAADGAADGGWASVDGADGAGGNGRADGGVGLDGGGSMQVGGCGCRVATGTSGMRGPRATGLVGLALVLAAGRRSRRRRGLPAGG